MLGDVPGLSCSVRARVGKLELEVELETHGTLVLIGPNGAGKTTLLSLILGIASEVEVRRLRLSVGQVLLVDSDRRIDTPVETRRIAYVPQHYGLFPHMTVREQFAFAMRSAHRAEAPPHAVDALLEEYGLLEFSARRPRELSGGERQRVALARALSVQPRAILLDEPLAALDIEARQEMRARLASTLEKIRIPAIVVTHDPADARALCSTVAVLEGGRLVQSARWDGLMASPATAFVREFVRL
jgi:molybdate transport system ATP-binding protein